MPSALTVQLCGRVTRPGAQTHLTTSVPPMVQMTDERTETAIIGAEMADIDQGQGISDGKEADQGRRSTSGGREATPAKETAGGIEMASGTA